jgi:hypothetical protein
MHTEFWWGNLLKKYLFRQSRSIWEDNIKVDIWEIGCEDGIEVDQDSAHWQVLVVSGVEPLGSTARDIIQ